MNIQSGKLYKNRTWKYLYPILKYYGEDLKTQLSSFIKLGVGVGDTNKREERNCIYILIDSSVPLNGVDSQDYKRKFAKFLDWISYKDYYVSDYVFESLQNSKHMVILEIPPIFDTAYFYFVKGNYSHMYSEKLINLYFKDVKIKNKFIQKKLNDNLKITRQILKKDKEYLPIFLDIVNTEFKVKVTPWDFKHAELDYPPKLEEEIFNYKKE